VGEVVEFAQRKAGKAELEHDLAGLECVQMLEKALFFYAVAFGIEKLEEFLVSELERVRSTDRGA
jgi:hypothetical protein